MVVPAARSQPTIRIHDGELFDLRADFANDCSLLKSLREQGLDQGQEQGCLPSVIDLGPDSVAVTNDGLRCLLRLSSELLPDEPENDATVAFNRTFPHFAVQRRLARNKHVFAHHMAPQLIAATNVSNSIIDHVSIIRMLNSRGLAGSGVPRSRQTATAALLVLGNDHRGEPV